MSDDVERSDAPVGRISLLTVALIAVLLLVCAAVAGMLLLFDRHSPPEAPPPPAALTPPEPRLQVDEPVQRHRLEMEASGALAPRGARQGIDRAMQHVARDGWPAEAPR